MYKENGILFVSKEKWNTEFSEKWMYDIEFTISENKTKRAFPSRWIVIYNKYMTHIHSKTCRKENKKRLNIRRTHKDDPS